MTQKDLEDADAALADFARRSADKAPLVGQKVELLRQETRTQFDAQIRPLKAKLDLEPVSTLQKLVELKLLIIYSWPEGQLDLDTRTDFLSGQVGWNYPSSAPYLEWTGDNTGAGPEQTEVKVQDALANAEWSGSTFVYCHADWYTPAGGTGGATLTVKNERTGQEETLEISPGQQTTGATSLVGTVEFFEDGTFTLT